MLYHAEGLAGAGASVTLVGRVESPLPERTVRLEGVTVVPLPPRPPRRGLLVEAARWGTETSQLLWHLARARPDVVLVQAPPLVPAAFAAIAAALLCGARLVVDWHNLGDALLALGPRGAGAPAAFLGSLERSVARAADAHLAVSPEMADALGGVREVRGARVFRDRPHDRFGAPTATESRDFRARLLASLALPFPEPPLVALSPTSWGRDEELDLLLGTARALEERAPSGRPVLLLVSGEGEGRRSFEERASDIEARIGSRRVALRTTFVAGDDYPLLVSAADVGISLHRPAAGLDPPMKVADLLGAGVPVLERRGGPAPGSLVVPGFNGLTFADAASLATCLALLVCEEERLAALRRGAAATRSPSFGEAWRLEAGPVLLGGAG